ncbi:hypothetical protein EGR_08054 [Echinococcus granulosus]|uniref:Uncharacterized protein n=1 Tax=Echinococcus granulosus TaxID=6210 RepID=W6U9C1_ECHGR|nr:hypothetical protein EGR_08054 [Echinococcus granulosus]EUB57106.1 hypothetical protein EGR_08054 [Echinococcus granulosus]
MVSQPDVPPQSLSFTLSVRHTYRTLNYVTTSTIGPKLLQQIASRSVSQSVSQPLMSKCLCWQGVNNVQVLGPLEASQWQGKFGDQPNLTNESRLRHMSSNHWVKCQASCRNSSTWMRLHDINPSNSEVKTYQCELTFQWPVTPTKVITSFKGPTMTDHHLLSIPVPPASVSDPTADDFQGLAHSSCRSVSPFSVIVPPLPIFCVDEMKLLLHGSATASSPQMWTSDGIEFSRPSLNLSSLSLTWPQLTASGLSCGWFIRKRN